MEDKMRYKTKDGNDYSLPNRGRTVNGIIVTDKPIENPLFELFQDEPTSTPQTTTPPVQPTPPANPAPVPAAPQVNEQKEQN
jgi:hypothetical protein